MRDIIDIIEKVFKRVNKRGIYMKRNIGRDIGRV